MKKQEILRLRRFSRYVGDFIRYWGFRRIHGQIWVVIYLLQRSLSGAEIVEILGVSKALVSPAIKELVDEGLILQVDSENSKTKRYEAESDVEKIVKGVLERREKPMIDEILKSYDQLNLSLADQDMINRERMQKLGSMIQTAQMGLTLLLSSDQLYS